jgi:DNA-binding NarL/FixJ family response regulator
MTHLAVFAASPERRSFLEDIARAAGTLVDSAGDPVALRRLLDRSVVDVVLGEGVAADEIAALTAAFPVLRVIMLAEESEATDLVLAGAAAVLPRDTPAGAIGSTVALTGLGLRLLPGSALDQLRSLADEETAPASEDETPTLTPREREVLLAMADGASNKIIARRLGISFHTAKFHVAAILAKLDADTRTEALARAARLGLVML